MDNNGKIEVILRSADTQKEFSIWSFIRRYMKRLIIALVVAVLVGAVGSAGYGIYSSRSNLTAEEAFQSALTAEDRDFLGQALSRGEYSNVEITYYIEEEISRTSRLRSQLELLYAGDEPSDLKRNLATIQAVLNDSSAMITGMRERIASYPPLLGDESVGTLQNIIDENNITIEIYQQELDREIANADILETSAYNLYAQTRITIETLKRRNEELEKVIRGEVSLSAVDQLAMEALLRSIDTSLSLLNDAKADLASIARDIDEQNLEALSPTSSITMIAAIFIAGSVGVFMLGFILLLVWDSIRNAEVGGGGGVNLGYSARGS